MPVIDVHAHIYPSKIAAKAVAAVGKFYCYEEMSGEGTPEDLLGIYGGSPITHAIVHSVATTPKSVPSINTFLAEQGQLHPEFISFGTMHHDFPDKEAEVERALELGVRGFKLHPDTQEVNMDDPRLMEFYEIIAGRVPLILHTGDYRYDYSNPQRLVNIMRRTSTVCTWMCQAHSLGSAAAICASSFANGASTACCSDRITPCGIHASSSTS